MTSGTSAWPNEMVSLFRIPPQDRQAGSASPFAHTLQRIGHRRALSRNPST